MAKFEKRENTATNERFLVIFATSDGMVGRLANPYSHGTRFPPIKDDTILTIKRTLPQTTGPSESSEYSVIISSEFRAPDDPARAWDLSPATEFEGSSSSIHYEDRERLGCSTAGGIQARYGFSIRFVTARDPSSTRKTSCSSF
jgi:hypothetical protein